MDAASPSPQVWHRNVDAPLRHGRVAAHDWHTRRCNRGSEEGSSSACLASEGGNVCNSLLPTMPVGAGSTQHMCPAAAPMLADTAHTVLNKTGCQAIIPGSIKLTICAKCKAPLATKNSVQVRNHRNRCWVGLPGIRGHEAQSGVRGPVVLRSWQHRHSPQQLTHRVIAGKVLGARDIWGGQVPGLRMRCRCGMRGSRWRRRRSGGGGAVAAPREACLDPLWEMFRSRKCVQSAVFASPAGGHPRGGTARPAQEPNNLPVVPRHTRATLEQPSRSTISAKGRMATVGSGSALASLLSARKQGSN